MKSQFYIKPTIKGLHNASKGGKFYRVDPVPENTKVNLLTVEADDLPNAILAFLAIPVPVTPKPLRAITKRELVDKLIEAGIASHFNALLGTLPLEEKLRWESSPTISPDYPFIKNNRDYLCRVLGITGEQLDNIFR